MSNWKRRPLGEISDTCLGKMLDEEKNKGELKPYLANINVRWGSFSLNNLSQMRFEEYEDERYGLRNGDLIICEGGEPGRCAIWRGQIPNMKIQKALHRLRVKPGYSVEFLYYRMLLAGRLKELDKFFIGSTIKHLTGITLKQIEFNFPNELEQTKIASVLSAIDAKIELNNRINAELEAMAKTLYDYWFVQFDFPFDFASCPERSRREGKPAANGKPYKSSGGKMVYNPSLKREIPEGWEATTVGKIAKTALGGTPSTEVDDYWENADIPWLSSAETASFPVVGSEQKITQKGLEDSAATLLPKGTVVISIVRYIRPSILGIDAATNQSVVGIKECSRLKSSFIYPYFCSEVPRLMGIRTGAQQPHINKGVIDESPIVLPTDYVLEEYYKKVDPIYEQIMTLAFENRQLIELRDWLLPILMNGQVTVQSSTE